MFVHSCMIWPPKVRVWTVIRFSLFHSPALWDTDTSLFTRVHSYQIYSGMWQTSAVCTFSPAKCWQNFLATFTCIVSSKGQAIFRIVPGGVVFTFGSRPLTNSYGADSCPLCSFPVLNQLSEHIDITLFMSEGCFLSEKQNWTIFKELSSSKHSGKKQL